MTTTGFWSLIRHCFNPVIQARANCRAINHLTWYIKGFDYCNNISCTLLARALCGGRNVAQFINVFLTLWRIYLKASHAGWPYCIIFQHVVIQISTIYLFLTPHNTGKYLMLKLSCWRRLFWSFIFYSVNKKKPESATKDEPRWTSVQRRSCRKYTWKKVFLQESKISSGHTQLNSHTILMPFGDFISSPDKFAAFLGFTTFNIFGRNTRLFSDVIISE